MGAELATRDIRTASTADLKTELAKGLTLTVQTLARLAIIWAELESRGEDLSDLRRGIAAMLPLIAAGTLAPEAVVGFGSRPSLLRALVGLPLEKQRAIAAGEPVPLVTDAGDGEYAVTPLPASALTAAQVRQVFAVGEIRDADQQRAMIEARRSPVRRIDPEPVRNYRVRPDVEGGVVRVGKATVKPAEIVSALSAMSGTLAPLELDKETETATVRLTAAEKQRLRVAEKRRGLPEWHLIREALHAYGLI
jgi:hypothetical protein